MSHNVRKLINIKFFNHGGLGDIHVSRSFINDIVQYPHFVCQYYSNHSNYILNDIDITMDKMLDGLTREMKLRSLHNTHFMNTWYGHGTHTTLQTLYNNFKPLYNVLNIPQRDLLSYLPKINYSKFNINPINNYIKAFKKKNEKYILVCNNDCNSNQSTNFDMNPLIKEIAEKFKNDTIIVTNDQQNRINMNNVVYFKDILDIEIDLNEISYLSTKCDVIIGKNSGPHTFCYVEENINRNSCFISIVNQRWPYYDFGLKQLNTRSTFINIDVNKITEIVNHIKGFCDASNK